MARCPESNYLQGGHNYREAMNGWEVCTWCGNKRRIKHAEAPVHTMTNINKSPLDKHAGCMGAMFGIIALGAGLLATAVEVVRNLI